ncbi:MAG: glycosyltransferase [Alphaproteobacteria bacterium]|nr:glycosyltransferase [Alphaproteobacteria bacterium]
MNLLVLNLAMDERHTTLAFGIAWVERLARRFEHVDVVTMQAGPFKVPANVTVRSMGLEHGRSKFRRVAAFYTAISEVLRTRRIHVVFAHMNWVFALLFAPLGRALGLRTLMWYAHGAVPFGLRFADVAVHRVVTSTVEGYRLQSCKRRVIGQGVDLAPFLALPMARALPCRLTIITVSRLAPSKGIDRMLHALARFAEDAPLPWQFRIVGEGTTELERKHGDDLRRLAVTLGIASEVVFLGRLQTPAIAREMGAAHVMLNLSTTGSLDKALIEAMAAGCLVISTNSAYGPIARAAGVGRWAVAASEVGQAILDAATLAETERQAIAECLRNASRSHDIEGLIERLNRELIELARS